ncbi:MAG: aminomethyltransferase family protein [Armatimonadota bacterium]|nr:aminomethyltransferase family protein [Armatimonadota bacterium]
MTLVVSPRDWFGSNTPASYTEVEAEYRVLREGAAVLDMSTLGMIRVRGDDRLTYLQGQLSQDVLPLQEAGRATLSCLLKPTGQMLSDMVLFSTEDAIWIITPPHRHPLVHQRLEQFVILEDVEVEDVSGSHALLHVTGARSAACLTSWGITQPLPLWQGKTLQWQGQTLHLLRTDRCGEPGYDLLAPVESTEQLWEALQEAGAQPIGYEAFHIRRVEAGIPLFGIDMDENTIPLEAGLGERAISFTKGCYTGQEVIHRIYSRGHTNRSLVGLRLFGETLPPHRAPISVGERRDAGWVTSAVRSLSLGVVIALGYLRNEYVAPGTKVMVQQDPSPVEAQVTPLPFVEPRCA